MSHILIHKREHVSYIFQGLSCIKMYVLPFMMVIIGFLIGTINVILSEPTTLRVEFQDWQVRDISEE